MTWETPEQVQKNAAGQYRALINGEWVMADVVQQSADGQYRVMRAGGTEKKKAEKPPAAPSMSALDILKGKGPHGARMGPASFRRPMAAESGDPQETELAQQTLDLLVGGTGLYRGGFDLLSKPFTKEGEPGLGSRIWPKEGARESSPQRTMGALVDPVALATGATVAKAIPYMPIVGGGIAKGAKALLTNATSGGITGGVVGGLSDDGDAVTGAEIGAGLNTVLPPVLRGANRLVGGIRALGNPDPIRVAIRAAGDKVDEVIAALANARAATPGSRLTAGQASTKAHSAEFAALQKRVDAHEPSRHLEPHSVTEQTAQARHAALRSVGKTPDELKAAVTNRNNMSEANYNEAFAVKVEADDALRALQSNPYYRKGAESAKDLAESKGLLDEAGNVKPEHLTEYLHLVKEGIDKQLAIAAGTTDSLTATARAEATAQKERLVAWLKDNNPKYEAARAAHHEASKPINQMVRGQELEGRLIPPVSGGAQNPRSFGAGVRKQQRTLNERSGKTEFDDLTPEQQGVVKALLEDMNNDRLFERMARSGKQNLETRIQSFQIPSLGVFKPFLSAARGAFNRATGHVSKEALTKLVPLMDDPQLLAELMRQASPAKRRVYEALLAKHGLAALGGVVAASQEGAEQ